MGAMIATMTYLDPFFNLSFLYSAFTAELFLCELLINGISFWSLTRNVWSYQVLQLIKICRSIDVIVGLNSPFPCPYILIAAFLICALPCPITHPTSVCHLSQSLDGLIDVYKQTYHQDCLAFFTVIIALIMKISNAIFLITFMKFPIYHFAQCERLTYFPS